MCAPPLYGTETQTVQQPPTQPETILKHVRSKIPEIQTLTTPKKGLSKIISAIGLDRNGHKIAFIKWAETPNSPEATSIHTENENLQKIGQTPGTAQIKTFHPEIPILVTEYIHTPKNARWNKQNWETATTTLAQIQKLAPPGLKHQKNWDAFRDRGTETQKALQACLKDHKLALQLDAKYHALRQTLPNDTTCHSDTHVENWVLSEKGPILIDFEHLALGPQGYDETCLLAHINMPVKTRLQWLEKTKIDRDTASIVAGALAAQLAAGCQRKTGPWKNHCLKNWPQVAPFATALI